MNNPFESGRAELDPRDHDRRCGGSASRHASRNGRGVGLAFPGDPDQWQARPLGAAPREAHPASQRWRPRPHACPGLRRVASVDECIGRTLMAPCPCSPVGRPSAARSW
jgi:hypothetical protein